MHIGDRVRLGFETNLIGWDGDPYMRRWILYLGWITLRLHKFYRGDDDRAVHDHPWWFITFPLNTGYFEQVWTSERLEKRWVKRCRFHYRPATYRHLVCPISGPLWTFVIAGSRQRSWGFYPRPDRFVYWRDWVE